MSICIVAVLAFCLNIVLGNYRKRFRKMSVMWWILIHASIPVIIPLRIWMGTPGWAIPIFIGLAIAGQWVGSNSGTYLSKCKQQL